MAIMQLSVFLENRLGRLNEVLTVLSNNNINIRALSLAEKSSYGMLRLIVSDTAGAVEVLKKENIAVNTASVIAAEVSDKPGGLLDIMKLLEDNGINVEYIYAFVEKSGDKAVVVFRVEDTQKAENIFRGKSIRLLEEKDVSSF
ncbi:MAG TPA: ACT domain-containing protein [bacterium]|jgi:hypothetical protein|nr:ACT domain-containing protein [bacterium]